MSGKVIDAKAEPKFRNISDADKELQIPASQFQKFKKWIKLAMVCENLEHGTMIQCILLN